MSESHHRQMRLFRENSGKYMSYYSDMFKKGFVEQPKETESLKFSNRNYMPLPAVQGLIPPVQS
eukprot:1282203-Amorphochlora_amoeboformis.AAC.1